MKLKVAYCTTTDGFGKDEVKIINLSAFSELQSGRVIVFSKQQDNNLVNCVLKYLNIEPIQLFYIEIVN